MKVTSIDSLYYNGKKAVENPVWRSSTQKEGHVGRWVEAIQLLNVKGLTSWHVVKDFSMRRISPLKARAYPMLWYIGRDDATADSREGKLQRITTSLLTS